MKNTGFLKARNYSNHIALIEPKLIRFQRSHHWPERKEQIDVFSRYWSFAVINGDKSPVVALRDGKSIKLNGWQFVFIPSFSIVHWHILSDFIEWVGYFSDQKLDGVNYNEPIIFSCQKQELPNSILEIQKHLLKPKEVQLIGVYTSDPVAKKLKAWLDQSYQQGISQNEISKTLGVSKENLIRHFKNAYGLSPVQYRLKMRLAEAVGTLMIKPTSISQVAHDIGFKDVSFFNKVFKRELNAIPSRFQLRSLKTNSSIKRDIDK
ncbi:MAG: helix-turn-helix transcriptional regulator [Bdellovibrionaceae bacterium]|nr:helix-turn-helix transcriptional regulator [Pseudobdellovibrionaceae bacterium]